jgi:uncharacterized protein (TIGR03083 family)
MAPDPRLALIARVTAAFADEIDRVDPAAAVPWPWWPDVRALVGHLGGIHGWAAEVVRTGESVPDPDDLPAPVTGARAWYLRRREELLAALASAEPEAPCWVLAGCDRTSGFWRRRMLFETTKHLVDLRAAGGGRWRIADELGPADYADGIDELFAVFLARSRIGLARLPEPVRLESTDHDRRWLVLPDWTVVADSTGDVPAARISARTGDLALLVWQRADPFGGADRFDLNGDPRTVSAFRDAPIHP